MVLVNEIFANTGFQYSPATMPFADTSTTPSGPRSSRQPRSLRSTTSTCAIAAGAELVAQVSPAHGKLFVKTVERALASAGHRGACSCPPRASAAGSSRTARPSSWRLLGAQCGRVPRLRLGAGQGRLGEGLRARGRPTARRSRSSSACSGASHHLVEKDAATGVFVAARGSRGRDGRGCASGCRRTWSGSTGWRNCASGGAPRRHPILQSRPAWFAVEL